MDNLTPIINWAYAANPVLKLEMNNSNTSFEVVLRGDPNTIGAMVCDAMNSNPKVMEVFIVGIMNWCLKKGIDPCSLKQMVKPASPIIHS